MFENFRFVPDFHRLVGGRRTFKGFDLAAIAGVIVFGGAASAGGIFPPPKETCEPLTQVTDFGKNPGELLMCAHVPTGLPAGRPLVVALHGCSQQAKDYGDGPGWTQLADEYRFALLLPQQRKANNPMKCFNWFEPNDVKRHDATGTTGEAASIWAMIQKMQTDYKTDPKQIYVTGLSAGGAMTAALLAVYPEVFQGGAIVAGIPAGCAQDMAGGFSCMNTGKNLSPQEWGDRVRAAAPGHTTGDSVPKIAIWQGSADGTVNPTNADELVDQWTNVIGIDQTPDGTETINGTECKSYTDGSGTVLVTRCITPGMDHGVAIDPPGCGKPAPFILDKDICSSRLSVTLWGLTK
jgi:poly(hydroxyalkanoate) depolymerase family esterase